MSPIIGIMLFILAIYGLIKLNKFTDKPDDSWIPIFKCIKCGKRYLLNQISSSHCCLSCGNYAIALYTRPEKWEENWFTYKVTKWEESPCPYISSGEILIDQKNETN